MGTRLLSRFDRQGAVANSVRLSAIEKQARAHLLAIEVEVCRSAPARGGTFNTTAQTITSLARAEIERAQAHIARDPMVRHWVVPTEALVIHRDNPRSPC
jgi:hypothetical protein